MAEKVTVVVPIYNVEKYLRQCLDSIVNQTYKNLEIILIDDGSPDACGAICDEYATADERIIVIHKENAGVSAARNDGIERATGEWVMFVDPDDWLELDCCERVIRVALDRKESIIYFQREMDDEDGECALRYPSVDSFQLDQKTIHSMQLECYRGRPDSLGFESMVPWAKLYRLEFIIKNACRFPVGIKKRQDVIFNLYCQEYLRSAYFYNYIGYHKRVNPKSICYRHNIEMLDIILSYLHEMMKMVQTFHNGERAYIKAIGFQSYVVLREVENLFFFYPHRELGFKEYRECMETYYSDETVKQCITDVNMADFNSMGQKIRFCFVSRHWLFPYYCIRRLKAMTKERIL